MIEIELGFTEESLRELSKARLAQMVLWQSRQLARVVREYALLEWEMERMKQAGEVGTP